MIKWLYYPNGSFCLSAVPDWQTSTEQDKNANRGRKQNCTNDSNSCLTLWYAKDHLLKGTKTSQCSTGAVKSETYSLSWQPLIRKHCFHPSFLIILLSGLCNDVQWYHQPTTVCLSFYFYRQNQVSFLWSALPVALWVTGGKSLLLRFSSSAMMYCGPLFCYARYLENVLFISWVFSKYSPPPQEMQRESTVAMQYLSLNTILTISGLEFQWVTEPCSLTSHFPYWPYYSWYSPYSWYPLVVSS